MYSVDGVVWAVARTRSSQRRSSNAGGGVPARAAATASKASPTHRRHVFHGSVPKTLATTCSIRERSPMAQQT